MKINRKNITVEPLFKNKKKNAIQLFIDRNVNVTAVECLSEFGQQDSEYTEDYALVTQRQVSSLTEQTGPASAPVPKPRYVLHVATREGLLFYPLFFLYI
jgi:hypothetical protein